MSENILLKINGFKIGCVTLFVYVEYFIIIT